MAKLDLKSPAQERPAASESFLQRDSMLPDRTVGRHLPLFPGILELLTPNLIFMSRIYNFLEHISFGVLIR